MAHAQDISPIGTVLAKYSKIRVADYQRNYDWSTNQIDALWDDVNGAIDANRVHFLGNLIIENTETNSAGISSGQIVDGQQRITTIFLFIARLRDEAKALTLKELPGNENERDVNPNRELEDFLYGKSEKNKNPRFIGNELVNDYLDRALREFSGDDKKRKIEKRKKGNDAQMSKAFRKAWWHVREIIQEDLNGFKGGEKAKLQRINELTNGFMNRLQLLPITTQDSSESLNIFLTINDRGLPLGIFDLVKGQIVNALSSESSGEERAKIYEKNLAEWKLILENLGASDADKFLRHFLLFKLSEKDPKAKLTSKEVPNKTEKLISKGERGFQKRATELWKDLQEFSSIYGSLGDPQQDNDHFMPLAILNLIADSYRILAMKIVDKSTALTRKEQDALFELLIVAVLKWNIRGGNAQVFETELVNICHNLKSKESFREVKRMLKELCEGEVDVGDFIDEGVSSQWVRVLLMLLEWKLAPNASQLRLSSIQIEHIAPQQPTEHWREKMNSQHTTYQELCDDLGNLTLIDEKINNKVKTKEFAVKKSEYIKSRCILTREVAECKDWDPATLRKRRDWIVNSVDSILNFKEINSFS